MIRFELPLSALRTPRLQIETKMRKREALMRKPIGILLSVLGLLLFPGATIPVSAQYTRYTDPRYILGTPGVTPGLPGEQLVRAAEADLYAYNFKALFPSWKKEFG
jgi:hypothetical protein